MGRGICVCRLFLCSLLLHGCFLLGGDGLDNRAVAHEVAYAFDGDGLAGLKAGGDNVVLAVVDVEDLDGG